MAAEFLPHLVAVDRLEFDPDNPRLPESVDGTSREEVLDWMLSDATLLDLIGSVAANGFFPGEPLLVCPTPKKRPLAKAAEDPKQKLLVAEGNRRLAAVYLLSHPEDAPRRKRALENLIEEYDREPPSELPVIIFPTRDDILDHLGYRHITGIKEWSPLAKARYVAQLQSRAGGTLSNNELAAMIGSKSWYVARLLTALELVQVLSDDGVLRRFGVTKEDVPFSLMLVALNREKIVRWLGLPEADVSQLEHLKKRNLRKLARWLFEEDEDGTTALGESRNMTYLAQIVGHDRAMEALDNGQPIEDAALLTLDAAKIFRVAISDAHKHATLALDNVPKRVTAADAEAAEELHSTAAELVDKVEERRATKTR